MKESLYTAREIEAPEHLTRPGKQFKIKLFLAIGGLLLFVVLYTTLMVWFGKLSWDLFEATFNGTKGGVVKFITAVCLAFLCFFMLKSLYIIKKPTDRNAKEITPDEQPLLFDFLHKLAEEARAPKPHKVYLSHYVNACVFYDLNIFNLFFPSRKNLEIGLGLINILNITEFKSVLAHEFGHFAQRSMLLGRYVYVAQQIAARVVAKRDALDSFLAGLSRIDIRIAWVGWLLSILVWGIRSLIETLFSVVAIAERALSREMEFHADLVAVSLTGSDALVNALHKLQAGEAGYQAALDFTNHLISEGKAPEDIYALQTNYIDKMKWILNDNTFGESPKEEVCRPDLRLFNSKDLTPPKMWATHPNDFDREENMKSIYVKSKINEQSAWELFQNPEKIKLDLTAQLVVSAEAKTETISVPESVELMNRKFYGRYFLDPKYRGAFVNRSTFLNFQSVDEIIEGPTDLNYKDVCSSLYPEELSDIIKSHEAVLLETQTLQNIQNEALTAEKRIVFHRGTQIKRKQIPGILTELSREEKELRDRLMHHDKRCRKLNHDLANELDPDLGRYHLQLMKLIHYAEHSFANLNDAHGLYHHVLRIILADGKVSDSERRKLIHESNQLHKVISKIYIESKHIKLDAHIVENIGKNYHELFEVFDMPMASEDNLQGWVNAIDSWAHQASTNLTVLKNACLHRLLEVESKVQEAFLNAAKPDIEIGEISEIKTYPTLLPGSERPRDYKLKFWDKIQSNDGIVATSIKFAASCVLVLGALFFARMNQYNEIYITNGLSQAVHVEIDGKALQISPFGRKQVDTGSGSSVRIVTTTLEGDTIEDFEGDLGHTGQVVYNVANSRVLYIYDGAYGPGEPRPTEYPGAPRWISVNADYIFEDAPETLSTSWKSSTVRKKVLDVFPDELSPYNLIDYVEDDSERKNMIQNHILWNLSENAFLSDWLSMSYREFSDVSLGNDRLKKFPNDIETYRFLLDYLDDQEADSLCQQLTLQSAADPENPGLFYLKVRCLEDGLPQDDGFLAGHAKWPDHPWLAWASSLVYATKNSWKDAAHCAGTALEQIQGLKSIGIPQYERFYRLMDGDKNDEKYKRLTNQESWSIYYSKLESGNEDVEMNNAEFAFYFLAQGNMPEAINHINSYGDFEARQFKWIAAASTGASESLVDEVLEFDLDSTLNDVNIYSALGLSLREKKRENEVVHWYISKLPESGDQRQQSVDFIQTLKQKNLSGANQILNDMNSFQLQAFLRLTGCIFLGSDAPKDWQEFVTKGIFITEKPFLGSVDV